MTLERLLSARELAGKQYQIAVDRLHQAYVELAAIDLALMNANVNDRHIDVQKIRTFVAGLAAIRSP